MLPCFHSSVANRCKKICTHLSGRTNFRGHPACIGGELSVLRRAYPSRGGPIHPAVDIYVPRWVYLSQGCAASPPQTLLPNFTLTPHPQTSTPNLTPKPHPQTSPPNLTSKPHSQTSLCNLDWAVAGALCLVSEVPLYRKGLSADTPVLKVPGTPVLKVPLY